jgi:hypothetical protein
MHTAIAGLSPARSQDYVCDWLLAAGRATGTP